MHRIGVDLGGTKTEAVLLNEYLDVVRRTRTPTPVDYPGIIDAISRLVAIMSDGISSYSVGVCTPGVTSDEAGVIRNSNTGCLTGRPLKKDLQDALGTKILMDNDANCFALAEARMGAARGFGLVFGVIMGTGVGGGIVIDGKIHHGRNGLGGEWGHHVLHRAGRPCWCGGAGCTERYLSGPSLEARWKEIAGVEMPIPDIVHNLDSKPGRAWKDEFLEDFGYGIAGIIDVLDPDAIVLGGGLSNIDFLYTQGIESVHDKVFSDRLTTPILKNALGDSAGVIGACLI